MMTAVKERRGIHSFYKWCIVPNCESTTTKTPTKIFIRVPKDMNQRKAWLQAVHRHPSDYSVTSTKIFVCEDHFNLETDMENYMEFSMMGCRRRMKPDVVPHIFACQPRVMKEKTNHSGFANAKNTKRKRVYVKIIKCDKSVVKQTQVRYDSQQYRHIGVQVDTETDFREENYWDVGVRADVRTYFRSKKVQCNIYDP